ncbi:MAG: hypothetical protein AB7P03_08795 [Kofleriaceae bacterium]
MTQPPTNDQGPMSELDALIQRARDANVRRDVADGYVRELDRWAQRPAAPRRWVPWVVSGLAVAAAIAVFVMRRPDVTAIDSPIHIGDRVAIVADPNTTYRVMRADGDATTIAVDRGRITARLWPGGAPHKLALEGGGVVATATGTVYSLAVTSQGASVEVERGSVRVEGADGAHSVRAGEIWPASAARSDHRASARLLELSAPEPSPAPASPAPAPPLPPPPAVADAGAIDPSHDAGVRGGAHPADVAADPPLSIKDRWRRARLLRAQAKFNEALADCEVIADANDPVWSPIALVEAARIYAGPLANPERAIQLADRMIREWPAATLTGEARTLRCQALAQLGRSPPECDQPAR